MSDNCDYLVEEYNKCIRNIYTSTDNTHANTCFFIWDKLLKCKQEDKSTIKINELKYCTLSNYYSFSSIRE
jgi:hypothetical protein